MLIKIMRKFLNGAYATALSLNTKNRQEPTRIKMLLFMKKMNENKNRMFSNLKIRKVEVKN